MKYYRTYRTFLKTFAIKVLLICLLISSYTNTFSQDTISFFQKADNYIPARGKAVEIGLGVTYVASMTGLYTLWYKDYPLGNFHGFDDNEEWLQVDKVGHFSSAYYLGKWGIDLMQWTGMERKQAIWKGGAIGWIFLTGIEVFDGFSDQWGFSTGDMIANTAGSALAIGQELAWNEQRIAVKFSYHPSGIAGYRPDQLGSTTTESLFKDYNGQTYWLSANIHSFLADDSRFPKWLNIAFGYGADGMTGARSNIDLPASYKPFERQRQFYFAPDIDLSKIKTNRKGLQTLFSVIGFLKFPAPSIEINDKGKVNGHILYF